MRTRPKTKDQRPKIQIKNFQKFVGFFSVVLVFGFWFLVSPFAFAKTIEKQQSATSIPTIYPRSSWASAAYDKRTRKIWPADYEDPKIIIIHHTATKYKGTASKQIKKIYRYHSYTRKWGDIGYNYIIGRDGSIFEGRAGGNGAIGGHSYANGTNYNKGSIGIAVLGNYQSDSLAPASLDALQRLTGWLAATSGIDIGAETKFFSKNLKSAVVGHKDVADTACPGKNIYSQFASIRLQAADLTAVYQNYAYQAAGEAEVFEITGGKRYAGSAKTPVVGISATQLAAYALAGSAAPASASGGYIYPSDTLVEVQGTGQIGVLENGVLRPIATAKALDLSFKSSNSVKILAEKWASYPAGPVVGFRSGTLVKDENENFYSIDGGQKRRLALSASDMQMIDATKIAVVSSAELAAYPSGADVTSAGEFPAGTLITNNGKKYFMVIAPGQKKEISKDVFNASFTSAMAVRVAKSVTQRYRNIGFLQYQDGATISYRGKYIFVEDGKRRQFASKNLAKAMGFKNFPKAKRRDTGQLADGARIE